MENGDRDPERACQETWSGRTEEKGEAMSEERAVQQVLARYVRGTDARDGAAVAAVFTEDGRVEMLRCASPTAFRWRSPASKELSMKAIIYRQYGGQRPSRSWFIVLSVGLKWRPSDWLM